jgi:hypothetical protein
VIGLTEQTDKLKEEKDLDPVAAQEILCRIVEEKKSAKPSIKINERHLDWCVDTLGSIWKAVKGRLFGDIFDKAEELFEAEMIDNKPADFGEESHEKLFEALSDAFSNSHSGGCGGYYSDDDGCHAKKESISDAFPKCVSLFREMKSIPQFPQKKLNDIRKEILCTREQALNSLVYLETFRTLWDYEWNYSSEYQHLADACQVLLEDNKELIQHLKKEANTKSKLALKKTPSKR